MSAESIHPENLPGSNRVIVAFSGGPDSVCLLHQLAACDSGREVVCVHIDHGLDAESRKRADQAADIAARLGVECETIRVTVENGHGPEAAARDARYRAFEKRVGPEDVLVTAHHADDQTETVLLRLLRGAGPEGLAGIPIVRRFGRGWLARPLIEWRRSDIESWIERHRLDCIRDPANDCPGFDRNHLRHDVLPILRERWPGVDSALRRSARLCRGAADFVADRVADDLEQAGGDQLTLDQLTDDSAFYRAAVIRAWCIRNAVQPPPGQRLEEFVEQISSADADRCPQLRWGEHILRHWANRIWLETDQEPAVDWYLQWDGREPLVLPDGLGRLEFLGPAGSPLELEVRAGQEGQSLRPAGAPHHRPCKRLLAEIGVPPWQRNQWPRLWLDGQLVALGSRWRTAEFDKLLLRRNQSLQWHSGPRRLESTGLKSNP